MSRLVAIALLAVGCFAAFEVEAQGRPATAVVSEADLARCAPLERIMKEQLGMAAETSPDSIDDWRTHLTLPACRVTAAGSAVTRDPGDENLIFYLTLTQSGWERTPDPHDRPQDAALRLRYEGADCFFTPYVGIRLFTEAEFRVNHAYKAPEGETRYNYLAVCMEALPAAP